MDPDPDADADPAIFVSDLQDVKKKIYMYFTVFLFFYFLFLKLFVAKFFCLLLFECKITSFFKEKKVILKSQNSSNQCFSFYFCLMLEGS
jgi:hypothetical protein